MTSYHPFLSPDKCSSLGRLILKYMNAQGLSPQEMAQKLKVTPAALRIACDRYGSPGTRMIPKLALVLEKSEAVIRRITYEDKLNAIRGSNLS